jgi:MFS superfamily sulfate permease-like transporter
LGGLPITGVIVRSRVNVGAGAGSRASAMCHGFWLLLFVGFAPSLLQLIPTSCLAAILVFTGFKLMSPARAKELWARGYSEIAIYAVTVAAIVATDLLSGVLVGIAASLLFLLFRFAQFQIRVHRHPEPHTYVLHLEGRATFLGLPKLAAALDRVERGASAEFRVDDLHYIDHACWEMIAQWRRFHESTDGRIEADWDRLKAKLPSAR